MGVILTMNIFSKPIIMLKNANLTKILSFLRLLAVINLLLKNHIYRIVEVA
jgi:hypothetical protein